MMIDEKLRERAKLSGCEFTDGQILFVVAELEKERVFNSFFREHDLEFINERTRESILRDFEDLIAAPENKDSDMELEEILNLLVTDETGDFIWDLFTPQSGRKNRLEVYGDNYGNFDGSKILPPCGSMGTGVTEGTNPFDRNSWNMAEQSKIYKENPEIAKYLASVAKGK